MNTRLPRFSLVILALFAGFVVNVGAEPVEPPEGFQALFNGVDFTNWIVPEGDGGHWQVIDGVIDYDAMSQAPGDKNLWTEDSFSDFELHLEWRLKETPFVNPGVPIIRPDGSYKLDADGEVIRFPLPDSDSGVFVRGTPKAQVNIWTWPVGSGEVWGYRTDGSMPPEVHAAVTPNIMADNNIGEWNHFVITVRGNVLNVELNGHHVIVDAELPGLPETGPIALQHHGSKRGGEWVSSPSLVQFRNIFIKNLD